MVGYSSNFDWSSNISTLLNPSSPIPGDLVFKIVDNEDQMVASFEAHRFVILFLMFSSALDNLTLKIHLKFDNLFPQVCPRPAR